MINGTDLPEFAAADASQDFLQNEREGDSGTDGNQPISRRHLDRLDVSLFSGLRMLYH